MQQSRDDRLLEPGGIVFHAHDFLNLVEYDSADAVDLADRIDGAHFCGGWSGMVTVVNFKLRHFKSPQKTALIP